MYDQRQTCLLRLLEVDSLKVATHSDIQQLFLVSPLVVIINGSDHQKVITSIVME